MLTVKLDVDYARSSKRGDVQNRWNLKFKLFGSSIDVWLVNIKYQNSNAKSFVARVKGAFSSLALAPALA